MFSTEPVTADAERHDSAIIGAGTYAGERCAVSTTGHGDCFMRQVVAYDIAARTKYLRLPLETAVEQVSEHREGGIIALDSAGHIQMCFNTEVMHRGYIRSAGQPRVFIHSHEA